MHPDLEPVSDCGFFLPRETMTVSKENLIRKLENGMEPKILQEFLDSTREQDQEWKPVVQEVKALWDAGEIKVKKCYKCEATGQLMNGSLGLLCPNCYDDVEGDL